MKQATGYIHVNATSNKSIFTQRSCHSKERNFIYVCRSKDWALMTNFWSVPNNSWHSSFPNNFSTCLLYSTNFHSRFWFVILRKWAGKPNIWVWVLKLKLFTIQINFVSLFSITLDYQTWYPRTIPESPTWPVKIFPLLIKAMLAVVPEVLGNPDMVLGHVSMKSCKFWIYCLFYVKYWR